MIPIHKLLNRIRWDPEFAKGNLELGYYDRTENRMILVPLKELTFSTRAPLPFNWWIQKARCTVCLSIASVKCIRTRNAFGIDPIRVPLKPNNL